MELTLDQALQKGIEAHKAGQVQDADRYYTAILKANPKHPDANHNMGVLAVGVGKVEESLPFFKTAAGANPSTAQYWLSYIDALIKLDRIADAKAVLDQAKSKGAKGDAFDQIELRLNTSSVELKNTTQEAGSTQPNILDKLKLNKALKGAKQKIKDGQSKEEKKIYKDILEEFSKNKKALYENKALASKTLTNTLVSKEPPSDQLQVSVNLYTKGRYQEAIDKGSQLLEQFPNSINLYNIIGAANKGLGKLNEAIAAYKKALSIKPDYAVAYNNMGNALKDQDKLDEAIEVYKKALSIKPDYAVAYNNMGNALKDQGKLDEAIEVYKKALSIKPDYADAYYNMGITLQEKGKLDEAIEVYKKALSIKPDYADAYYNMGITLQEQGKLDEATEVYKKAIFIEPNNTDAHRTLSSITEYSSENLHFKQVIDLYNSKILSDDAKCHLSLTLAKMYEDVGKLEKAFEFLKEGNALRKKLLNYSIDQDKVPFSKFKRAQPSFLKNSLEIKESFTDSKPIFILGMPRSGTTLVEQIISSHSEVLGAGELTYVSQFGEHLAFDDKSNKTSAISIFRDQYLLEISKLSNCKQYITDKMPQNFRFIPLICAALPEAKIIHVQRNATATCWSNYKQYFASNSLGYCYDLQDIVEYYNLYKDMMRLWQSHYGDRIYNLHYESLTTDQENQTRKLINHLELNWEEACLSPQKNNRSVKTASQQQIRKKVYQGSSQAWRKYEPFLDGAFDSLKSK